MATLKLTKKESLQYFYNSLCNGLGYIQGHGIELTYNEEDYNKAKQALQSPCFEDVLIQILKDGNSLTLRDVEGSEEDASIKIQEVYSRVENTPFMHLMDMMNGHDDAITADVILQTVFLNEVIYG